jgi:thioredoxin 1
MYKIKKGKKRYPRSGVFRLPLYKSPQMKTILESISTEQAILVNFFTTWCGTCKVLKPELEKFSINNSHSYTIVDVNLDRDSHIISKFHIKTMPTLILFKEGKEIWLHVGLINASQLSREIGELEG